MSRKSKIIKGTKHNVTYYESILSKYSSKTCNLNKFLKYARCKIELMGILCPFYEDKFFRKLRYSQYINKQKSEDRLINELKNKFGKRIILAYGDWNFSLQNKNNGSVPGIGLKRRLAKEFDIINVDEFRTSKLCHKTEEECINMKKRIMRDENGVENIIREKVHLVLTFKKRINGIDHKMHINRDKNGVLNMLKITKSWLINRSRPKRYQRRVNYK